MLHCIDNADIKEDMSSLSRVNCALTCAFGNKIKRKNRIRNNWELISNLPVRNAYLITSSLSVFQYMLMAIRTYKRANHARNSWLRRAIEVPYCRRCIYRRHCLQTARTISFTDNGWMTCHVSALLISGVLTEEPHQHTCKLTFLLHEWLLY